MRTLLTNDRYKENANNSIVVYSIVQFMECPVEKVSLQLQWLKYTHRGNGRLLRLQKNKDNFRGKMIHSINLLNTQ